MLNQLLARTYAVSNYFLSKAAMIKNKCYYLINTFIFIENKLNISYNNIIILLKLIVLNIKKSNNNIMSSLSSNLNTSNVSNGMNTSTIVENEISGLAGKRKQRDELAYIPEISTENYSSSDQEEPRRIMSSLIDLARVSEITSLVDPYIHQHLECGESFSKTTIDFWFKAKNRITCPACHNIVYSINRFKPNIDLEIAIKAIKVNTQKNNYLKALEHLRNSYKFFIEKNYIQARKEAKKGLEITFDNDQTKSDLNTLIINSTAQIEQLSENSKSASSKAEPIASLSEEINNPLFYLATAASIVNPKNLNLTLNEKNRLDKIIKLVDPCIHIPRHTNTSCWQSISKVHVDSLFAKSKKNSCPNCLTTVGGGNFTIPNKTLSFAIELLKNNNSFFNNDQKNNYLKALEHLTNSYKLFNEKKYIEALEETLKCLATDYNNAQINSDLDTLIFDLNLQIDSL